jgi:hypothetical protein
MYLPCFWRPLCGSQRPGNLGVFKGLRDDHEEVVKVVLYVLHLHFATGDPLKCGGEEIKNCGQCAQSERQEEILVERLLPSGNRGATSHPGAPGCGEKHRRGRA